MEDSIQDYLRISQNVKNVTVNENTMKSTDVLATAQRKKEYEDYAMKIVIFLLDGKLRPEIFLKCLKYINQDYYQDVVEERAVSKLCGYPLCGKKMADMPKQKYIISTRANKVYDISERKNFCSNFCYKASLYIKDQIESSPLWHRNHKEMRDCNLLPATVLGTPGEEVDQGIIKPASELPNFTSVAEFTQLSLEEVEKIEKISKENYKPNIKKKLQEQPSLNVIKEDDMSDKDSEIEENEIEIQDSDDELERYSVNKYNTQGNIDINNKKEFKEYADKDNVNVNTENKKVNIVDKQNTTYMDEKDKLKYLISKLKIDNEPKIKLVDPSPMKILRSKIARSQQTESISVTTKKTMRSGVSDKINKNEIEDCVLSDNIHNEILKNVTSCVHEWITLDTFIYIYGEDKVKQVLNENTIGEYFYKLKVTELDQAQQLKYMNMCRRLNMQELAEEKFDNAVLGYELKPLPDFKQLKTEVRKLDLKVRSFYKGVLFETPDTNFPSKSVKENEASEDGTVVLPLVDISAQNSLRRKVFLNSINKTLKNLINELKLEETKVLTSIQELVKSFKLQAHNIVFRPIGWTLVAVILIKMLSLMDNNIEKQLKDQSSVEYLNLILSKYSGIEKNMEDIFIILSDVDKFVESYITQNSET